MKNKKSVCQHRLTCLAMLVLLICSLLVVPASAVGVEDLSGVRCYAGAVHDHDKRWGRIFCVEIVSFYIFAQRNKREIKL